MKTSRESAVRISVSVPQALYEQMAAAALRHDIPLSKLIVIWMESQVSPGADVVIGRAHS